MTKFNPLGVPVQTKDCRRGYAVADVQIGQSAYLAWASRGGGPCSAAGVDEQHSLVPADVLLMSVPKAYQVNRPPKLDPHQLLYRSLGELQRSGYGYTYAWAWPLQVVHHADV